MNRRILLGEPGSGKTSRILEEVRGFLRAGRAQFRLVTPTATMAEHLRNLLAREGLVVRPRAVLTLARFVQEIMPGKQAAQRADLRALSARVLEEKRPPAFRAMLDRPGLARALVRAMEELANAGCDALQWQALGDLGVHTGERLAALGEVYSALEEELKNRGLELRAWRIAQAAQSAGQGAAAAIEQVWFDGFFTLTPAERRLAAELARHSRVTVSLPEWQGAQPAIDGLRGAGFEIIRLPVCRLTPVRTVAACSNAAGEAEEIARRILALAREGVPWREMGVITRRAEPYAGLLQLVFARCGIPWRDYFSAPLERHPLARIFLAAMESADAGFDHALLLPALVSPVALAGNHPCRDDFDFRVRAGLPDRGLAPLRRIAAGISRSGPLARMLAVLEDLGDAGAGALRPQEWARRLTRLERLVAGPDLEGPAGPEALRVWRMRAAALHGVRETLSHAAGLLPDEPILLSGFLRMFRDCLSAVDVRLPARERDAVSLLDAQEARQWELQHVFVAGLQEGVFPPAHAPDSILDEDTRLSLNRHGVPLRLAAAREQEEAFLFRMALTRATRSVTLTYPLADDQGDPTLQAYELARLGLAEEPSVPLRLRAEPGPPPPAPRILDQELKSRLMIQHAAQKSTAIESYLQCPFQFFARYTLKLKGPPPDPSQRLDARVIGILLHDVLAEAHRGAADPEAVFDERWKQTLAKERIREGYRTAENEAMLRRTLVDYLLDPKVEPGFKVESEQEFEIPLHGFTLRGRIDRYDTGPEGSCRIYDFKLGGQSRISRYEQGMDSGLIVQPGLYTAALEALGLKPVSFTLVGLRDRARWQEFDEGELAALRDRAMAAARRAWEEIGAGRIDPYPADAAKCRSCDYRDACRVGAAGAGKSMPALG